jgi:hypothetical protein
MIGKIQVHLLELPVENALRRLEWNQKFIKGYTFVWDKEESSVDIYGNRMEHLLSR